MKRIKKVIELIIQFSFYFVYICKNKLIMLCFKFYVDGKKFLRDEELILKWLYFLVLNFFRIKFVVFKKF